MSTPLSVDFEAGGGGEGYREETDENGNVSLSALKQQKDPTGKLAGLQSADARRGARKARRRPRALCASHPPAQCNSNRIAPTKIPQGWSKS